MRHTFLLGTLCVLLSAATVSAAPELRASNAIQPEDLPRVQVLSERDSGVELQFELPALSVEDIPIDGRSFQLVGIPGGEIYGETGSPAVPCFTRLLAIPDGATVSVTVTPEEQVDLGGYRILPMQADQGKTFAYDEAAYARDSFGQLPEVKVGEPAYIRDVRVVPLTFQPVRYNPSSRTLNVVSSMRVEVRFDQDGPIVARTTPRVIPSSFEPIYRSLLMNPEAVLAGATVMPGSYLIICKNDSGITGILQPLVDWRKRKGQPATLATTAVAGTTKESIKAYIQNVYNTADPPLEYVALAGDASGTYAVPTWFESLSGYNGEGDHPYTQLSGGDVLADIHIGRLSFSNTVEAQVIVNKILGYEKTPELSDPGWFTRACLVGDPEDSGYSTVQVQQWIKTRLKQLGYTQIDTIYSQSFVTKMQASLNQGDSIFSYRGYWQMSGWSNTYTYALTNGYKMPFVVSITCDTGSFYDDSSCRTEGFLRANSGTSPYTPRGGIGAIGTATTGTHTRFNNCVHYGIFYGLLYEGDYNLGAALTRGKMELYLNYQVTEPNKVTIWSHWNNLMGDPAVECWTGYPAAMTVTHPSSIPIGTNSVTLSVQSSGAPQEGALVCLWKGSETYAVGYTDASGELELPVSTPTTGSMLVTVSKHNRYTYQGTITVSSATKHVALNASTVDDDSSGESTGNGDGVANPSESLELRVQLKNFGTQTTPAVTAILSSEDPYVTITDASESFGDIAAGATAWTADDFGLTIDNRCPAGRVVRLGLDIYSSTDHWHSLIDLPVASADLETTTYTLTNAGTNGLLDPGETVQLAVTLANRGGASATTPSATLVTQSEYVDVPDASGVYGTIAVSGNGTNNGDTFTIHAAPETYQGYSARLQLLLSFSGGAVDTTYVNIPIGTRTADDPTGPDHYGYYAFDNTDVSYPECPTYSWVEIDPTYGGSGTEVVLGDMGEYQDKSRVVDIPFTFKYYGANYTKATICSNGWVAMGSQWNTEYRNWTIPGAGGPQAMIAPFWDDLYQGTGKVYQKYDSANHRWIVQWSRIRNMYGGSTVTFQAILLDPAYHTTETGDGEIIFQYMTISNPDATDMYATVGIENAMHSDGVLWTYYAQYAPGAASLAANRAIRFVPKREVLAGQLSGVVRNELADLLPINGATVRVVENGHQYTTGAAGTYGGSEMAGVYSLIATHAGFEPDTVSNVQITAGSSVEVDFALLDNLPPVVQSTPLPSTDDTVGPYTVTATVTDASPLSDTKVFYRLDGGSFNEATMSPVHGTSYEALIPGQPWSTKVEYYVYVSDAAGHVTTDPRNAPDGVYTFYVAPTVTIFADDFENDRGWTIGAPDDTAVSGLWVRCDPTATFHDTLMVQTEDDHTGSPGVNCFVTGNAAPGALETDADVDGGKTTLTSMILFPPLEGTVTLRYWRWFSNDTDLTPAEDYWTVQVSGDDGQTWVNLERTKVSERHWKKMEFDLGRYVDLQSKVRIRFIAEDANNLSVVEAAVDDIEVRFVGKIGVTEAPDAGLPVTFGMLQNKPNPFSPQTAISFALDKPCNAQLLVCDVQGRVLRRLVGETLPAGQHTVVWDGRDDAGRHAPSGIYFYRLEAGGRMQTRKMIMVE